MIRVVTAARCLGHQPPAGFPEQPERLAGILAHLRAAGLDVVDLDELDSGEPAEGGTQPGVLGVHRRGGEARDVTAGHDSDWPETPARLASPAEAASPAVGKDGRARVEPAGIWQPPAGARAAVEALHPASYVRRFESAVKRGDTLLDSADNPLSPGVWGAAWGAVEATLAAADWVAAGNDRVGFAAVRPPGHHAEADTAMGFCFFGNVAVAAEHLRRRHGAERVAIFDFDVHHGNGTQHLFEARSDVFYASTHQYPFYPGTGARDEVGIGAGEGATLNVPLPAGTGDAGFEAAITGIVLPALRRFAPDILLLSAGFDAWQRDPLGGMAVTEEGFARWGEWLRDLAAEVCGGRVLAVLEGGYDLARLPRLVAAHLQGLVAG